MRKQYDCVDATKLIMSLFVIAIHTNLFNGSLFPTIRLAVPIFFIFTGFFSFRKINAVPLSEQKRILWFIEKRYFLLYLFWFTVLLPITIYVREYYTYNLLDFIKVFLKNLFLGSTFQASWYLMACILGIAIVFLLSKVPLIISLFFGILTYFLATCASKYQLLIANNSILNMLFSTVSYFIGNSYNNVFIAIIYIIVGKMIAEQRIKYYNIKRSFIGFCICYLGLLCEFSFAQNHLWFVYNCDCWFYVAPTAIFFALFILSLEIKIPHAQVMRSMSTIIYCSHLPIVMVVSKGLSICNIVDTQNILLFSITLICTFVLCYIIFRLENNRKFSFLKYSH